MTIAPDLAHTQNFIRSSRLVDALLDRTSIGRDDLVYEIGPGTGIITASLATRCGRLVAIEKDRGLAALLTRRFSDRRCVTIAEGDFLATALPATSYKVFGNIPFDITTAIVTKLTSASNPPEEAYLAVQKEAADRFMGQPRGSLYAARLWPWFETALLHHFRREDFTPRPGVDVVLIRIAKRGPPLIAPHEAQLYRDFITYVFTVRQPSVGATLDHLAGRQSSSRHLRAAGLDWHTPPGSVRFEQWLALFHHFIESARARALARVAGADQRLHRQQHHLRGVAHPHHHPGQAHSRSLIEHRPRNAIVRLAPRIDGGR
jgi:23S rRNA (adenine-N6)-dimethyltransferase